MNVGKVILGVGAAVGLMSSTVAMAATTRSSAALPTVKAPISGVRTATTLKKKSSQSDESMTGTYVVGGLAAAAVIAGIVVVASDNNNKNDNSSSPG
ncbi:hypothetical protein EAH79_16950 [Sphingomonas koreensis]|nr:hypothetical protein EAH79_16950 [Sphingomonas koreensis]